jgi:ribosome biogenesis GTPase / thiamine phosphate phosphatase
MKGLVTKSTGSWYTVRDEQGNYHECRIAGKIRLDDRKTTNPVVVGDHVEFSIEDDAAVINKIDERRNYIIRKSINLSKQTQIIAANLDQAFLIATLVLPRTSTGFIDRFLVTAEAYQIPAVLVFNKSDLLDEELTKIQDELMGVYRNIGYKCIPVSATEKTGLEELREMMKYKTSLISGHSGVGKSTLINSIQPGLELKTGEISEAHFKGKHTTTFSELFELDFGGYIIDTPGIKELGLVEMKKEEVGHYFPEIRNRMNECRFNNCLHVNEPKCAVRAAVETGEIDAERYHNYLSILNGEEMDWKEWER